MSTTATKPAPAAPPYEDTAKYLDGPRLLADIGGTNARFALETGPGQIETIRVLRCADHAEFGDAVEAYLRQAAAPSVRHAAIAIANPVQGDAIRMTNHDWAFSIEATRRRLNFDTLLLVNDFTALAMALPHLDSSHLQQIGGGKSRRDAVIGLVGAGTGLGVGGLIPGEGRWIALGSEGGHVSFSPTDADQAAVLAYCWKAYRHVSAERLVSGPGIALIHAALAERAGRSEAPLAPPEIMRRAMAEGDPLCLQVIDCFCAMLGTVASNVAVTLGTLGGIFIGGGVVPHLGDYFARSPFRSHFENKGRFSTYLEQIPTSLITAPYPAFVGVAAILSEHLGGGNAIPILERIRKSHAQFSPAEQKVASLILEHPRMIMRDPIGEIARRADVSQPTVIRFCRALGCQGLADFKRKLSASMAGTVPLSHSQVRIGDAPLDVGVKVVDNTISAMLEVRDKLNGDTLESAITALTQASRIEFFGFGSSGLVAEDARQKFFRMGIPCAASSDPQWQAVAAAMLVPGDVVVAISSSGRLRHLAPAVDAALAAGATVIALAPAGSPLARRAHLTLAVDHDEPTPEHLPMVSRILLLLLIDLLAVGVSLDQSSPFAQLRRQARRGILTQTPAHSGLELAADSASPESPPERPVPVISHLA